MSTVVVEAIDSGATHNADIISKSDKRMVVVLEKTVIRLVLTRSDVRKPYVGNLHGLQFQSKG